MCVCGKDAHIYRSFAGTEEVGEESERGQSRKYLHNISSTGQLKFLPSGELFFPEAILCICGRVWRSVCVCERLRVAILLAQEREIFALFDSVFDAYPGGKSIFFLCFM